MIYQLLLIYLGGSLFGSSNAFNTLFGRSNSSSNSIITLQSGNDVSLDNIYEATNTFFTDNTNIAWIEARFTPDILLHTRRKRVQSGSSLTTISRNQKNILLEIFFPPNIDVKYN
jgi:hypothetical protein